MHPVGRVLALGRGMLVMRPKIGVSSSTVVAGHTLRLDDGQKAAVLCWRGGLCFATLPPGSEVVGEPEVTHEPDGAFELPVGEALGGRIIDCLGAPLDGGRAFDADAPRRALLGPVPEAATLKPIDRSLHTGTTAIDALTPLGCGQSLLLMGQGGTGKTALGWDAVLAQARQADLHPVLGLSRGGASEGMRALAQLRERGEHALCSRTTVVATRQPEGATAAERALVAAAACAVAEERRQAGAHALVLLDDFNGVMDVWDEAGEAVAAHGAAYAGATERHIERSEQRIFYAAYLQRVAQMDAARGGGSLTLIAMLHQPAPADAAAHATFGTLAPAAPAPASAPASASASVAFSLEDFASHSASEQARVEALLQRGVRVDAAVLKKIAIRPPVASPTAAAASSTAAASTAADATAPATTPSEGASARQEAFARSLRHIDQLTSLADAHVQLHSELRAAGWAPALEPAECIARVGAGTDAAVRPQPSTPAMRAVASNLRLELTLARDQLPGAVDDAHARSQRRRAAAYRAVLCAQPAAAPLRLSQQVALLLALADGKLDGLGEAAPAEAGAAVRTLLARVEDAAPQALAAVDETGELPDAEREALRAAVEPLPGASVGRRAFFGTWDSTTPDAEGSLAAKARGKIE